RPTVCSADGRERFLQEKREGEEVERERMREEDRLKGSTVLNRRGRSAALDGRGLSRASEFPRL
ncbi:hypothetical protein K402DRAFT_397821, partial [Aulographum hederae CBS 113979]